MEALELCRAHREALLIVVGFLSGIVIHVTIFIWSEWHLQAAQIFLQFCALYIASPILANVLQGSLAGEIFHAIVTWGYGYLAGLVTSILVYRTVLHPLTRAGYPGPWYAKVTKIWHVWAARNSKNHLVLDGLYKKYGAFVRTGMNRRRNISCLFLFFSQNMKKAKKKKKKRVHC